MSLSPFFKDILRGGLPEALDLGRNTGQSSDTRAEQTAPTGTVAGTEPSVVAAGSGFVFPSLPFNVSSGQILSTTVVIVGVLAAIKFLKG